MRQKNEKVKKWENEKKKLKAEKYFYLGFPELDNSWYLKVTIEPFLGGFFLCLSLNPVPISNSIPFGRIHCNAPFLKKNKKIKK